MAAEDFGDLLLDVGLPDVDLLDDLQLDCGLNDLALPPGLDGLGLDISGAPAADPATSDLLESLQMDAFSHPVSSTGAHHSSGSGSDSPVQLPLVAGAALGVSGAGVAAATVGAASDRASPATSESEYNGQPGRGRDVSPATAVSQRTAAATAAARGAAAGQQQQQQAGGGQQPRYATEEEKRLARMQRNRENAQLSRQRKKAHMTDLEQRNAALQAHNTQLAAAVQRLTAENAALRQQLALVCQQAAAARGGSPAAAAAAGQKAAGAPAAAAPKAATPAAAAQHTKPVAASVAAQPALAAAAAAVAARPGLLQWPLLPFGFLPKATVTPQQQQQQRPGAVPAGAPAKPVQPAPAAGATRPAPAAAAAATDRAPKRAKTAAGASTAFLALFTLFMFAGPFTPTPLTTTTAGSGVGAGVGVPATAGHRALQALPDAAAAGSGHLAGSLHHTGRGLQALPEAGSLDGSSGSTFGPQQLPPAEARLRLDTDSSAAGGHLQALLNSTLQALLLQPGNAALEAAALQRLQELGPVALLLDADSQGAAGASPLAASVAFPQLADQLFGSAGLEVPQMCQQVLEFDAASVPHAARSRRSLERFVLGATGFRGRSLAAVGSGSGSGSSGESLRPEARRQGAPAAAAVNEPLRIEQPADGELWEDEGEEPVVGSKAGSGGLLPRSGSAGSAPVLVSVLLPANASGGGRLAAADKVFVVLLHPQERYVTYSCALPRPVAL